MLRTAFVIDYQNVHMTARDLFDKYGDIHDSLIHPVQFARRAIHARNSAQRAGYPAAELASTIVFRGLPHVDHDPEQHRRNLAQATQWRNDGAVVELRDLKYKYQYSAGRPITDINGKKIPEGRPQEKGIDVLCALEVVMQAQRPDVDLVILASRDTDLRPALDLVYDQHGKHPTEWAKVETVHWYNQANRQSGRYAGGPLMATAPRQVFRTALGKDCYDAAIDRNDYK